MKHIRRLYPFLLVLVMALAFFPVAFAMGEVSADDPDNTEPPEVSTAPTPPTEPEEPTPTPTPTPEPTPTPIEAKLTNGILNFSDKTATEEGSVTSVLKDLITDGEPYYVSGLSVAPAQGTLYLGYLSEANPGAGVATTQILYFNSTNYESVDNVTFVPNPNFIGDAEISFSVYSSKAGPPVTGTIKVKVEQQEAALAYSSNGDPIRFQAEDFSAWCLSVTGRSIRSVTFTLPSAREGTMYYNYIDENIYDNLVDTGTQYFRVGLPSISNITLIPAEDYNGTFYVSFSGTDIAGVSVSGRVRISISGGAPSTGSGLTYFVNAGQRVPFGVDDFAKACQSETGFDLDYILFPTLPSSSQGTLYYDGTAVKSTSTPTYYYYSGSHPYLIGKLSFVADGGYDGTVTIPFVGYTVEGTSFSSVITIEISGSELMDFSYTVKAGQRVYIGSAGANEIAEACLAATGAQLSYVQFPTLPSSSYGTLYHNNATVPNNPSNPTKYYYTAGSTYSLQNVNFLANDNYEGSVSIPFTACSSRGTDFYGSLHIQVTDAGYSTIRYTVVAGQRVKLSEDAFANICYQRTGYPLNYVRFTSLPDASRGVFYENDTTKVATATSYYRTGNTHLLGNLSFVADADYSGTFTVGYTCYSSSSGKNYTGTLYITVTAASAAQTSLITYYTTGPAARFSASNFSSATSRALSDSLAGIRFDAPDASAGQMFYAYTSPASHSTFVPGQSYSTSLLSQIYFLPRAGYSGTVNISYTATDNSGNSATGTVQVIVTPPAVSSYFTDMERSSWAVPAVDFLYAYQIVDGVGGNEYAPSSDMIRGDFVLMLSRTYAFPYAGTGSFSDVPQDSYYAAAIASARMMGIAESDATGQFYPSQPITRQDAAVMLHRCMRQNGQNLTGTEGALFGFSDSGTIAPHAIEAMAALVRHGIFQGDDRGLLNPTAYLTRAEMATILHRAVTY